MRKIGTLIFALGCAFFLLGCGGENAAVVGEKSPTETLRALNEASKKKDPAAIKSHLSKGTLDLLEQSAARQEKTVDELLRQENGAPFQELSEMKNEQITGETASVEVKNEVTGEFEKIPFVREDGRWKVALDVFMKDAMKRLAEEMNKPPANSPAADGEPQKPAANTAPASNSK